MTGYAIKLRVQAAMDRARDIGADEIINLLAPIVAKGKARQQPVLKTVHRMARPVRSHLKPTKAK